MRNIFPSVYGNSRIKEIIGQAIADGSNSHAYIIEGDMGSGKKTIAYNICAAVMCERKTDADGPLPCGECASCVKVMGKVSPDVIYYSAADGKSIGVAAVRELKSTVSYVPNDSDRKVYIIDGADRMTKEAQNALLSVLESPPSYVIFLLLCERSDLLLETIRSRAIKVGTEKFSRDSIVRYITEKTDIRDSGKASRIAFMSDGSIGRALMLASDGAMYEQSRRTADDAGNFVSMMLDGDRASLVRSGAEILKTYQKKLRQFIVLCDEVLSDIAEHKASGTSSSFSMDEGKMAALSGKYSIRKLMGYHGIFRDALSYLDSNVSEKAVMAFMASSAGTR